MSRADRFLWSTMSLGAAAAVVIVALLTFDAVSPRAPDAVPPNQASARALTQDYMAQLAAGRAPY
jgi:hypothetical protein